MKIASVASHQRQGIRLGILVAASVVFGEHRILEHVYETKEEHRIKELAAILKDGHFPDYTTRAAPTVTHHDPFKHQEDKLKHAKKGDSIPTDMLMKAYLEGNDQYTSQGTGQSNKNDTQPSKSPVDKKTASPKSTPSPKTSRPTSSSSPTEMDKGKKDKKGSKGKSSDSSEDASPSKTPKGMKNKPSAPSTSPRPLASVTLAPASNNTTGVTNQTISPGNPSVIRTLSTSAFEYILTSEAEPTESELNDLLNITESVFRDLYVAFFLSRPDAGFSKLQISSLTAHRRTLIEFHVDLFFQGNGTVPDLAQLEEVARQQFAAGAEYEILYLERLQTSSIYGSTSLLLFISDEEELIALVALADQSSGTNISVNETVATIDPRAKGNSSSSVTRIVSPLAAFAGVLVIIGALVHIKRNRNASGLDRNENLMKHTRDDEYCAETGTISGNTYRTSAFSDDGTFSSAPIFNAYKKKHQNYDHKKGQEKATEMDDVSLGDDARSTVSVTSGTHSRTNSFDSSSSVGTMVKAVRATMSADDFKPKAKQYDESKKPVWASRGTITQPKFTQLDTQEVDLEQIDDCCSQSVVNDELKDELYLPQLGNQNVAEEAKAMVTESKLSLPTEKKSGLDEHEPSTPIARHDAGHVVMERSVEVAASTDDEKPAWMKANVRPIASNPPSPSRAITSQPSSDEPEWMRKFKQMGLDKQE